MLRGSSTQLYIPAFDTRRISNPLARVPNSIGVPSYTITTSTWGKSTKPTTITSHLEGLAQSKQGSPHNLRDTTQGTKPNKDWVFNLVVQQSTTNNFFSHTICPIEWDSRCCSSVEKTNGMEIKNTKKNPWENNRNQDEKVQANSFPKNSFLWFFKP